MNVPIYNALRNYSNSCPTVFHMPGHKLGKGIPLSFLRDLYLMDLTEIPGLDSLYCPSGVIKEAQELAAKAFGADKTFFLVNGSTCGIQAAIITVCKPKDKLIIARDCHKSAVAGMMLSGAVPVYVKPQFNSSFGIPSIISEKEIEKALAENPDAVGVYITRPNYYGICSDIKSISELVHSYNKILIVDEAHGAHLKFSENLPPSSVEYGADICIQSAHKTLPALTQGAYLHVKGSRVDVEKLEFTLSLLGTTSPSYIIMAHLDIARAIMEETGEENIKRVLAGIEMLSSALSKSGVFKILSDDDINDGEIDRTRVVINVRNTGKTGFEFEKILRNQYNIQVEMSDLYNIVCITTVADTPEDIMRLQRAFVELADCPGKSGGQRKFEKEFKIDCLDIPEQRVEPAAVMHSGFVKRKLYDAVGCVSRTMITPYPPGIPVVCPGEVINGDIVEYIVKIIEAGGVVNGVSSSLEVDVIDRSNL
ncbi:aminotransferase class V-fold PLP-dependent enzyme [Acetivibrio thermocellus]|uniref:aminotransferase class I/II-fold pyridoxal phosphate-dependent enzyme n=1 Tax=Acetivibrio thermocellus TaxID=1515 RepID=UPI0021AE173E|nr:aminotransferase class V-fold PLP-dependent enzyme [Acetivibrio thermocellus]UWV48493.1 aminotransferase class V-fold PLP-dependent enzyme [Acetivibrio thermocellus]